MLDRKHVRFCFVLILAGQVACKTSSEGPHTMQPRDAVGNAILQGLGYANTTSVQASGSSSRMGPSTASSTTGTSSFAQTLLTQPSSSLSSSAATSPFQLQSPSSVLTNVSSPGLLTTSGGLDNRTSSDVSSTTSLTPSQQDFSPIDGQRTSVATSAAPSNRSPSPSTAVNETVQSTNARTTLESLYAITSNLTTNTSGFPTASIGQKVNYTSTTQTLNSANSSQYISCNSEWLAYFAAANVESTVVSTALATYFTASETALCDGTPRITGDIIPTSTSTELWRNIMVWSNSSVPTPSCKVDVSACSWLSSSKNVAVQQFSTNCIVTFSLASDTATFLVGNELHGTTTRTIATPPVTVAPIITLQNNTYLPTSTSTGNATTLVCYGYDDGFGTVGADLNLPVSGQVCAGSLGFSNRCLGTLPVLVATTCDPNVIELAAVAAMSPSAAVISSLPLGLSSSTRCTISGGTVKLLYFPLASTVSRDMCATAPATTGTFCPYGVTLQDSTQSCVETGLGSVIAGSGSSVVSGNQTYYENKVYISLEKAVARSWDALASSYVIIGNMHTGTLLTMDSSRLYSVCASAHTTIGAHQVDFADFNYPIPATALICQPGCDAYSAVEGIDLQSRVDIFSAYGNDLFYVNDQPVIRTGLQYCPLGNQLWDVSYAPVLAVPPEIRTLDPLWADCELDLQGLYDPPSALQAGTTVDGPSLPVTLAAPNPTASSVAPPTSAQDSSFPLSTSSPRQTRSPLTSSLDSDQDLGITTSLSVVTIFQVTKTSSQAAQRKASTSPIIDPTSRDPSLPTSLTSDAVSTYASSSAAHNLFGESQGAGSDAATPALGSVDGGAQSAGTGADTGNGAASGTGANVGNGGVQDTGQYQTANEDTSLTASGSGNEAENGDAQDPGQTPAASGGILPSPSIIGNGDTQASGQSQATNVDVIGVASATSNEGQISHNAAVTGDSASYPSVNFPVATGYVIESSAIAPGGQGVSDSGTMFSALPTGQGVQTVTGGTTFFISGAAASSLRVLLSSAAGRQTNVADTQLSAVTIGGSVMNYQALGFTAVAIGSQTLAVGQAAVTENGKVLSLATERLGGLDLVVNGITTQLLPQATPSVQGQVITVNGHAVTASALGALKVILDNSKTLSLGDPTLFENGEAFYLAEESGGVAIAVVIAQPESPFDVVSLNGHRLTAFSAAPSAVVVNGITLSVGKGPATLDSKTISLKLVSGGLALLDGTSTGLLTGGSIKTVNMPPLASMIFSVVEADASGFTMVTESSTSLAAARPTTTSPPKGIQTQAITTASHQSGALVHRDYSPSLWGVSVLLTIHLIPRVI